MILQSEWFATIPGKGHNTINSVLPDPFPVGWGLAHETTMYLHFLCGSVCLVQLGTPPQLLQLLLPVMNYNYLPLPGFHQNTSLLQFEGVSQVALRAHHLNVVDGNFSFIFSISKDLASSRTAELVKNLSLKQLIFSHTPFHIMKSLKSNSVRKKLTRVQHGCH